MIIRGTRSINKLRSRKHFKSEAPKKAKLPPVNRRLIIQEEIDHENSNITLSFTKIIIVCTFIYRSANTSRRSHRRK